jgi:putative membrane protein
VTSPNDLPAATKLALDRTRLAYERTLMAWVRTSASMISFGFTIYKALQLLRENANVPPSSGITPREFGMGMMALGVIALALATIQHETSLRAMRREYGFPMPISVAATVSVILSVIGIFGLVAVYLHY